MAAKKQKPQVESIEDYAKRIVASAPPFTEEQIVKMTAIVRGGRREATK